MNVVFLSPGFPAEMPEFVRGLSEVGARVFGVGDQPLPAVPQQARAGLTDYLQVRWGDDDEVIAAVRSWLRGRSIDRVETMWETLMLLAARLREQFGVPGMTVAETVPFRDKETMKAMVEAAGGRVPRHGRARTTSEAWAAIERVGYPAIVKPIAGAGSKDTHRCGDRAEFERALQLTRHVAEVSVEEYVEGEELTFDTVCAGGEVLYHNVAWYRPKPLELAKSPWISMQNFVLRDPTVPLAKPGLELGMKVLAALRFGTGFTHMEWFHTPSGEAVFCEIAARAAGARLVHAMNYACDLDLFRGWAHAVCHGSLGQEVTRKYNAAMVFKRAQGEGDIVREYRGLDALLQRYGEHVANIELTPIGQPRRNWRQVVVGDGWLVVRHPDFDFTREMADRFCADFTVVAG